MATAKDVLKLIKEKDVKYVDLRFTDPRGKWQHVTFDVGLIDEEALTEGLMFDGSSIAGWKAINESDMKLMPDPDAVGDRSVLRADHAVDRLRHSRAADRRALRARPALDRQEGRRLSAQTKIGDAVFFGPEAEFFVFDDVKFSADAVQHRLPLDDVELPTNSDTDYETGNPGHRVAPRAAISRFRRMTRCRTCAPRCWRPWPRWAPRSRSTTTRWPRPSTSSASSSARW